MVFSIGKTIVCFKYPKFRILRFGKGDGGYWWKDGVNDLTVWMPNSLPDIIEDFEYEKSISWKDAIKTAKKMMRE